jgi:hypothetical protein
VTPLDGAYFLDSVSKISDLTGSLLRADRGSRSRAETHYDDGRLLVIAPQLNTECQAAITRYRTELITDDPAETRFQAITLEDITTAMGCAGAHAVAERISNRYLNLEPVHRALVETFRPAQSAA